MQNESYRITAWLVDTMLSLFFLLFSHGHACGSQPRVVCDLNHNLLDTVDQIEFGFYRFPTGEVFNCLSKNLVSLHILVEVIEFDSFESESYVLCMLIQADFNEMLTLR